MSRLLLCVVLACVASTSFAHFPDRASKPVHPYFEGFFGPFGNRLPMSHRRKYNRPSQIGGWLSYLAAPSSQEAMAWHNATHRGNYKKKMPRTEMHYFYPKPWEMITVGPRPTTGDGDNVPATGDAEGTPVSGDGDNAPAPPESTFQPRYGTDLPASVIDVLEEMNKQ